MTATPRDRGPSNATPEVANLGSVRPPLVYLASLVTGSIIQVAVPLPFFPRALAAPVGGSLILGAILLFVYAVKEFRAAGTPVPARKPTTVIVRTGPYRLSRNPIYLAFSLLQLGIAMVRCRVLGLQRLRAPLAVGSPGRAPMVRRMTGGLPGRSLL